MPAASVANDRQSLARALFSGEDVIILDDVLAGVDRITESSILDAVFGRDGLLRQWNATTILSTSSGKYCSCAMTTLC